MCSDSVRSLREAELLRHSVRKQKNGLFFAFYRFIHLLVITHPICHPARSPAQRNGDAGSVEEFNKGNLEKMALNKFYLSMLI